MNEHERAEAAMVDRSINESQPNPFAPLKPVPRPSRLNPKAEEPEHEDL